VVTAVYILRAAGKSVMGPITNPHFNELGDAQWNEKLAAVILISGIVVIGIVPFYLNNLITPGTEQIILQTGQALLK
jgi:NADH-quinone oxidoreductase subunit M